MIPFIRSRYSMLRNLPYVFKGNSIEKKLRATLLIAGVSTAFAGIYMVWWNSMHQNTLTAFLYCVSTTLGFYICRVAFLNHLQRNLYITVHALLIAIIVFLLFDNNHPSQKLAEYNYLLALTVGSALVLRQQTRYLNKVFPVICLCCYLFFIFTGTVWQQGAFHAQVMQDSGVYFVNSIVPMVALLLTAFTLRGSYTETDLIKQELSHAINKQQLDLHYQPQVDTEKNVIGFEILLRWKHPAKGFISPEVFIPVAEKSGLIIAIGNWVMERTFHQIAVWERQLPLKNLVFSINISPLQLMHRDFTQDTLLLLAQYKIRPERVKFEITETTFIYDQKRIAAVIQHFSDLGIKWAIDDFGVGYSSLKSLSDFAIDDIKIDKSLIMHLFDNESTAIVVNKTIELSRAMGLNVLAEGIESEDCFDYLREKGCHLFQGYHFARPLPVNDALLWIKKAVVQ